MRVPGAHGYGRQRVSQMSVDERGGGPIQSVDRAARILRAFTVPQQQLSVTDVAQLIGVHKSTASRLIATLVQAGLLEGGGDGVPLRLGPELRRLARLAFEGNELSEVARAPMEELAGASGETVTLSVREGEYAVTIAQSGGTHRVGVQSWVGARTPLAHTADGKVLLVFGAEDPVGGGWRREASVEVARIRKQGWASARGELEEHLYGVAVPVWDQPGEGRRCLAALCVSGPSYRVTEARFPELAGELRVRAGQIAERRRRYLERTS